MKYTVGTKIEGKKIICETSFIPDESIMRDSGTGVLAQQISRRVADTEDKAIREALIRLGWTPPDDV
jgi:hypothetical protein